MATPGMLFVTMRPQQSLSLNQFHEWYNNEHGPTRLRFPDIFATGQRYISTGSNTTDVPPFLATYDVKDMTFLTKPVYTNLRAHRSPREAETIGQVDVKRYFFDLQSSRQSSDYVPLAEQSDTDVGNNGVLVYVDVTLSDTKGAEDEVVRWYEDEHIPMLTKVPGWLRTRRYRTSHLDLANGMPLRLVTLHEYKTVNGLGGAEHKASMDTPWRTEVFSKCIVNKGRRTYSLFYVFGPAPRDLEHLAKLPPSLAFVSSDAKTATMPPASKSACAVLRSFVTTADGLEIPYRLEGNPASDAPTIAFCNSLLTSLQMWDDFVAILKTHRPDLRILRYDARGRHALPLPALPATMEMLADDLHTLLSALRIAKLDTLVGVSMGGATTLQFVLKYPERASKFVACDFNVVSSDANTVAWKERIGVAEAGGDGMKTLARLTVSRWFHPLTAGKRPAVTAAMTDIVAANNRDGFKYSCQALWDYDLRSAAKGLQVPGLLVAGEADGKGTLAKAMEGFRPSLGNGKVALRIVPGAGHLPMFENPEGFWQSVENFL